MPPYDIRFPIKEWSGVFLCDTQKKWIAKNNAIATPLPAEFKTQSCVHFKGIYLKAELNKLINWTFQKLIHSKTREFLIKVLLTEQDWCSIHKNNDYLISACLDLKYIMCESGEHENESLIIEK